MMTTMGMMMIVHVTMNTTTANTLSLREKYSNLTAVLGSSSLIACRISVLSNYYKNIVLVLPGKRIL